MASPSLLRVHHHVCLERRGGATKAAKLLIRALSELGHACTWSYELAETSPENASVETPAGIAPGEQLAPADIALAPEGIFHLHATADHLTALRALAGRQEPVVVTAHDCSWLTGGCIFPMNCEGFSRDCDPCPRGYAEAARVRVDRRTALAALSPILVAPSRWMAGLLRAAFPGTQVAVAPNGVAIPSRLPAKAQAKAALGVSPQAKVALFLAHGGRLAEYKGGGQFLDIWEGIKGRVPEAVGFIAGGPEHGRRDDLIFWPYLEDEALTRIYAASDVFVYPSLADNHPLAVLEAMAHGLPVAAYAVGGIPEQLPDDRFGRLVFRGEAGRLIDQAALLLASPSLARSVARAALARCREHFPVLRMAKDYLRVYSGSEAGL
jgi:glycosyltransferase involved in cell wall biosynthesis